MALTVKQARFVDEYINEPGNASEAARRAGYSPHEINKHACKILKHPKIAEAIDREHERMRDRFRVDRDWLANRLLKIIRDEDTPAVDMVDAIRELGLLFGLYPKQ